MSLPQNRVNLLLKVSVAALFLAGLFYIVFVDSSLNQNIDSVLATKPVLTHVDIDQPTTCATHFSLSTAEESQAHWLPGMLWHCDSIDALLAGPVATANPLWAYWQGLAHLQRNNISETMILWQQIDLPAETVLQQRHDAFASGKTPLLRTLVDIATQLEPVILPGINPLRDIVGAANDYEVWGLEDESIELKRYAASKLDEQNPQHWYLTIDATVSAGEPESALALLNEALLQWPEDHWLHRRMTLLLFAENKWDDARMAAETWLTVFPDDSEAFYMLAESYYRQGDLDSAEIWYRDALSHADDIPSSRQETIAARLAEIAQWRSGE